MHWVRGTVSRALAAITVLVAAGALGAGALYEAPAPGADLEPQGGAAAEVLIDQDGTSLVWATTGGQVAYHEVKGWPSSVDEHDLGGALVIEKPADPAGGEISFGEKPASVLFHLTG